MKKYITLKLLLSCILLVTIFSFQENTDTHAASSTSKATVTAQVLNVRQQPSPNAKILGKLQKNAVVTVYNVNKNGWAKIKYNNKTAYISAHYIKYGKNFTSYKRNKNYIYQYKYYYDYDAYIYGVSYSKPITYIKTTAAGDFWSDGSVWKETASGLKITVNKSSSQFNRTATYLKYPLKNKLIFYNTNSDNYKEQYRIASVGQKVKLEKRTWTGSVNLLVYGDDMSYSFYFAPNAGIVMSINSTSKVAELIMYKKKN